MKKQSAKRLPFHCLALILCLLAAILSGCGKSVSMRVQSGEFKGMEIGRVRVCSLGENAEWRMQNDAFRPIRGVETRLETDSAEQTMRILETFANWSAKDNLRDAVDSAGKLFVCFDDKLSIEYIGKAAAANAEHYGRVYMNGEVISCELPEAFGKFIAEL